MSTPEIVQVKVYATMDALVMKQINTLHGGYWFSPSTMRHWGTRVCESTITRSQRDPHVWYFVTSDLNWQRDRMYSIRKFDDRSGAVSTVDGAHMNFISRATALRHTQWTAHSGE